MWDLPIQPWEDHEAERRSEWYEFNRWWDDEEDVIEGLIAANLLPGPATFIDTCRIKDEYLNDGIWVRGRYWTGDDEESDGSGQWVEFRGELDIQYAKRSSISWEVK